MVKSKLDDAIFMNWLHTLKHNRFVKKLWVHIEVLYHHFLTKHPLEG